MLPLVLALGGLDYVLARNLLVAWVPLSIAVAGGLASPRVGTAGVAVAGLLVVFGIGVVATTASNPKFDAEDWRGAARALGPAPPGGRAIVLWPGAGAAPFRLYRPDAAERPVAGARFSEVVVLTFGASRRDADLGQDLAPPRPPFRPVERRDETYFTLIRYVADEPVALDLGSLAPGGPAVLVER